MPDHDIIKHSYPTSFVSNNDKRAIRLRTLPNETLLKSVRKFRASLSRGQQTKAGLTKLIVDGFGRQSNELVRLSIEALYEFVSPPLHFPKLQLPLVCQFVHSRYGAVVASHLLCEPIRWDPPKSIANHVAVSSVNWLQASIDQLTSANSSQTGQARSPLVWPDMRLPGLTKFTRPDEGKSEPSTSYLSHSTNWIRLGSFVSIRLLSDRTGLHPISANFTSNVRRDLIFQVLDNS